MLEKYKKTGKPISPQMQKMADALDAMDSGGDGQVCMPLCSQTEAHCGPTDSGAAIVDPGPGCKREGYMLQMAQAHKPLLQPECVLVCTASSGSLQRSDAALAISTQQ